MRVHSDGSMSMVPGGGDAIGCATASAIAGPAAGAARRDLARRARFRIGCVLTRAAMLAMIAFGSVQPVIPRGRPVALSRQSSSVPAWVTSACKTSVGPAW